MTDQLTRFDIDYARQFPARFARDLAGGDLEAMADLLNALPNDIETPVFANMPATQFHALIGSGRLDVAAMLDSARFDDAIAVVKLLPEEQRLTAVTSLTNARRKRRLLQFMNYPPHSVGAVVVTSLTLRIDEPISQVGVKLRETDLQSEPRVIAVDANSRYVGVVDAWRLIAADPVTVANCVTKVRPLRPESSQASVAARTEWDERTWLPVVDHNGTVVGACTRASLHGSRLGTASADGAAGAVSDRSGFAALAFGVIRAFGTVANAMFSQSRS